jgi:hypothetical protein
MKTKQLRDLLFILPFLLVAFTAQAQNITSSDTASMLSGYARKGHVVKYTDTAGMLSVLLRKTDTAALLSGYARTANVVKYTDTAAMLANHATKAETLTGKSISGSQNILSDIPGSALVNNSLTIGSTIGALGSTVTSIAGLVALTSTSIGTTVLNLTPATATWTDTWKIYSDTIKTGVLPWRAVKIGNSFKNWWIGFGDNNGGAKGEIFFRNSVDGLTRLQSAHSSTGAMVYYLPDSLTASGTTLATVSRSTSQDTTTYKPVAQNASGQQIVVSYWPGSSALLSQQVDSLVSIMQLVDSAGAFVVPKYGYKSFRISSMARFDGGIGIATGSASNSLVLGASTNGFYQFNTSDEVTNYERARLYWSGNTYNITTHNGGSGILRDMAIGAANVKINIGSTQAYTFNSFYELMKTNRLGYLVYTNRNTGSNQGNYGLYYDSTNSNVALYAASTRRLTAHPSGVDITGLANISGNLVVGSGTGAVTNRVNGIAGDWKMYTIANNGVDVWAMTGNNTAVSGWATGTDFEHRRYNNSGGYIGTPFKISRETGLTTIHSLTVDSTALSTVGIANTGILTNTGDVRIIGRAYADTFRSTLGLYYTDVLQANKFVGSSANYAFTTMGIPTLGNALVVNDISGARYALRTGNYSFGFYKHRSTDDTYYPTYSSLSTNSTGYPAGHVWYVGDRQTALSIDSSKNLVAYSTVKTGSTVVVGSTAGNPSKRLTVYAQGEGDGIRIDNGSGYRLDLLASQTGNQINSVDGQPIILGGGNVRIDVMGSGAPADSVVTISNTGLRKVAASSFVKPVDTAAMLSPYAKVLQQELKDSVGQFLVPRFGYKNFKMAGSMTIGPNVIRPAAAANGSSVNELSGMSTATANNDLLYGTTVNPSFNTGAFTGVQTFALNTVGKLLINPNGPITQGLTRNLLGSSIYSTTDSAGVSTAAYPFNANGHLVIQGRSTADRDLAVILGATPTVRMILSGATGNLILGSATNNDDGVNKLQVTGAIKGNTITDGIASLSAAQLNRVGGAIELQFNAAGSVNMFGNTNNKINFQSGIIGMGMSNPNFALTMDSTRSVLGLALNGRADHVTNYERMRIYRSNDIFNIVSEAGGMGTARQMNFGSGSALRGLSYFPSGGNNYGTGQSALVEAFGGTGGVGNIFQVAHNSGGALIASSGTQNMMGIFPNINQTSTAGYRGLYMSVFEQATGSGSKLLVDLGTNSAANGGSTHTSKWKVDNSGNSTQAGIAATTGIVNTGTFTNTGNVNVTGTVTASAFAGSLTGYFQTTATTENATYYLPFVPQNTSGNLSYFNGANAPAITPSNGNISFKNNIAVTGTASAASFSGSGSALTGVVKTTDTAAMLSGYLRAGNIPAVTGKVNYTDTAGMLSGYVRMITPAAPSFGGLTLSGNMQGKGARFQTVGIGTPAPPVGGNVILSVNGHIVAKKLIVQANEWSDYVFEEGYKLRTLAQVEDYIKVNKHLPDVPSAKEVASEGISVGDNQALLLRKIEELTLYMIDQQKKIEMQEKRIRDLEQVKTKTVKTGLKGR